MIAALALAVLACGNERWEVKTVTDGFWPLLDADAEIVTDVEHTTIADLVVLPAPKWTPTLPRQDSERHIYEVTGLLLGAKLEDDGDLHVVVQELDIPSQGRHGWTTMVVEIPSPACMKGAPPVAVAQVTAARAAFLKLMRVSAKFKKYPKPLTVTVRGLLFFDKLHGQTGVAPNGVELHPVLALVPAS